MNRNNRLYTLEAGGEKKFTAAGLALQFWVLSEGAGDLLAAERLFARGIVDSVMAAWYATANRNTNLPGGMPGSAMNDVQLMQVIDTIVEACEAVGAALVFEIICRPHHTTVH